MHKINVLSHLKFDNIMNKNAWTDENVENLSDCAFISICCKPDIKKNYIEEVKHETDEHWFSKPHFNVLNVDFDDITDSVLETKYGRALGITIEQAQQIVDFIIDRYSKGVENWYLHCRAGRSRSAACGQFLIGFLKQYTDDVNDNGFLKDKINTFVWNKLLEAYNVSCT